MIRVLFVMVLMFSAPALAENYKIDYTKSTVGFSGKHAGKDFKGAFESWEGVIQFNADDLKSSSVSVKFKTSSAKTGNALYDKTLPQLDWFNIKQFPEAEFKSTSFEKAEDGSYKAQGMLKIRGIEKPVSFNFTLADLEGKMVQMKAVLPVERLAFDMGKKSDPKAEWVSREIKVTLDVVAGKM